MEMIRITVDGKAYEVQPGRNLLDACLSLGFNIPHFCYHHALGSVGSCRLCAVKTFNDADDRKGTIVMSCMVPVKEGMLVSTTDSDILEFRASVIENLMTNHPHDCPVCDEGGECHLQDMTVMTGNTYRRFDFKKRTHLNQNLGPNINHEMNRCIQCYRCVRFYRDYAGGKDFGVFGAHNNVYFGRYREGTLESEFSGNLVEVCPTGVFTDKSFKQHPTRKWDLSTAPSVCTGCGAGCNIITGERYGTLRRILNRYNEDVNGYFLCDKGRFGYEFVNAAERHKKVIIRDSKENENPVTRLSELMGDGTRIAGIGSARASLEVNFALMTLAGDQNFFHGVRKKEYSLLRAALDILHNAPAAPPSRMEMEGSDAVLILGEDLMQTSPITALAVRQAARNLSTGMAAASGIPSWHDNAVRIKGIHLKSPVFITGNEPSKLDDIAAGILHAPVETSARLGFAIASLICDEAPAVTLDDEQTTTLAQQIASSLINAEKPLVISGVGAGNEALLKAASNIVNALHSKGKDARLHLIMPDCNSMGIAMMGGNDLDDALEMPVDADTLVILENDLYERLSEEQTRALFKKFKSIIAIDHTQNRTTAAADMVLPSETFAGTTGTLVNNQGYAQRFYPVLRSGDPVLESWRWISDLAEISGKKCPPWPHFDQLVSQMAARFPEFKIISESLPAAGYRMSGQKIPRQTARYSGRTAMNAQVNVSEQKPLQDTDSALSYSMEGDQGIPPASLIARYWNPGWNSAQAIYKYTDGANGNIISGKAGIKLIQPSSNKTTKFFSL